MKHPTFPKTLMVVVGAVLAGGVFWTPLPAIADEVVLEGSLAQGGKLYDKWYKVVKADKPANTHKSYPKAGKKKGAATWRCKECHGWDAMGKDGAYAKGSHFTGIKGITGMAGADVSKIEAVLKDDIHGLKGLMDEKDFRDLALFVSKGQIDYDTYIDRATKNPKGGDKARGASYFQTICAGCHGVNGTLPKDMKKTLAKQMGNPWEVMHKIQNGQPDEKMPALRALDMQVTVDIMAYLQTLPMKK